MIKKYSSSGSSVIKRATISAKQYKVILIGDSMVGKTSII